MNAPIKIFYDLNENGLKTGTPPEMCVRACQKACQERETLFFYIYHTVILYIILLILLLTH